MKSIFILMIISAILFCSCRTTKPVTDSSVSAVSSEDVKPVVNFSEQTTWILGYFIRGQLEREPHSEWFMKGYDGYLFNTDVVNKLTDISKDILTIKIVLGTWCPDSRREVPRFMRIMDVWGFTAEKITFIGVDNSKLSPVGEYEKLNIERVPTFIFYKNNIELGRIIETPVTSLEQDMVNILNRNE
ncbi:MAG: thioredoxin family protein [Bacteroidota bacterium]